MNNVKRYETLSRAKSLNNWQPFLLGEKQLPLQVTCHECVFILYDGKEMKAPDEIINNYNGRCPNCRKKLSYIPKIVKIQPIDEIK